MTRTQFLIQLINDRKLKRFAEIGVYKGKTCRTILKNCPSLEIYWAVDSWLEYTKLGFENPTFKQGLLTQEQWDQMYIRNCLDMHYFPALKVFRGTLLQVAWLFRGRPNFDFIYIDGLHDKESVLADIAAWKPLVVEGGLLGGHDYGKGHRKGHRVAEAVNEAFTKEQINLGPDGVWYVFIGSSTDRAADS